MILSDKSSGSTVLQNELAKSKRVNTVIYTRHSENETLYWNKVVAILGLQQVIMKYSELPMNKKKAEKDLLFFFKKNLPNWQIPNFEKESFFIGWEKLCEKYGPNFLEKTPHHLHSWAALELIFELMSKSKIDFYFIGLIRNPVDALFSSWKRWNAVPEIYQFEWLRAYNNLLEFSRIVGKKMMIISYESLIRDKSTIQNICKFCGIKGDKVIGRGFHSKSIQKWKSDKLFGFQLSNDVKMLANSFGYRDRDLNNSTCILWPYYRIISGYYHIFRRAIRNNLDKMTYNIM